MSASVLALSVVLGTVVGSLLYGRRQANAKTVAEWAVGGRRLGFLIFWFLNAGEIYTTFAVLGISGYAWAYGAPAYLAFLSVSLATTIGYWLTPKIRQAGARRGLITQADFFADHYRARWLGAIVGIAGISALVIYVQIQITALSLILRLTVADMSQLSAAISAAVIMVAFVFSTGLRSAAFAAGVKDVLMILIVVALSATVAHHVGASSILDIFHQVEASFPGITSLPGRQPSARLDSTWLMTAALNVALGTYILPHMFQLCYSASDTKALRRNAVLQPLYSLSYFFIILLGFAALLAGTQPVDGDLNAVLLQFVTDRYPTWAVGLLSGTACLLALVPGSVLLLTAGSIFSRNVVLPLCPSLSDRTTLLISRGSMIGFAAVAVWLTVGGNRSLVEIGLSAYASIGMLAPGVFLAFLWPRTSAIGVAAGLLAGYTAMLLPAFEPLWAMIPSVEPGLVAMAINAVIVLAISAAVPRADDQVTARLDGPASESAAIREALT
jgi:SSS family solute:Na+ symporter